MPRHKPIPMVFEGVEYPSTNEAALCNGINYTTMKHYRDNGLTSFAEVDAFNDANRRRKVVFMGVEYPSAQEASKATHYHIETVYTYCRKQIKESKYLEE